MSIKDKIHAPMKNLFAVIFSLILVGSGCKSEAVPVVEVPVIPNPLASFSMETVAFGEVPVLNTGNDQAIKVKNVGGGSMSLSDIVVEGDFSVENRCTEALESGEFCYLILGFAPTTSGALTGTLTVASNSGDSPKVIPLSGTGLSTALFISPKAINFGEVVWVAPVDEATGPIPGSTPTTSTHAVITVKNIGSKSITGIKITNPVDPVATFFQNNTCPKNLEAGETCFVTVTFIPSSVGEFSSSFLISATSVSTTAITINGKSIADPNATSTIGEPLPTLQP